MKLTYLVFLAAVNVVYSYKILMIFPMGAKSHYILGSALGRGLAEAGHDVTMVSPMEDKKLIKNYKIVHAGFTLDQIGDQKFNAFDMENLHPWLTIFFMNSFGNDMVKSTFENPKFKNVLNEKFDVIILEQFVNDAMKGLECHFKAPLILFSSIGANPWVTLDVSSPSPPSYVPDISLSYSSKMNLWQRTFNSVTVLIKMLNQYFLVYTSQQKIFNQYFPHCAANTDLAKSNVSLVLLNSHESSNEPVPLVPNMINIGGYHISSPKELPKDLKEFMDNAKEGVVYFSMGSNIESSTIPEERQRVLINAFRKLRQKVLWKYDLDDLPKKPENIKLGKWFPQSDILAHPNTKLFITHGGLLSTLETIYHGVPILALPVYGDQKLNAAKAETAGYGKKLSFPELTEEQLTEALNALLNDPKYRENAKQRSLLMHDRPIKPLDLAIYWTEFIARHKGAPHLQVAGINLPWYQYFLLDVILMLALVITITFAVLFITCRKLCCSKKGSKNSQNSTDKKKKE